MSHHYEPDRTSTASGLVITVDFALDGYRFTAPRRIRVPGLRLSGIRPITGIGAGRFWMTPQFLFFERGAFRTDSQQVPIYGVLDVDVSQSLTQKARGVFTVRVHIDRGNRTEIVSMEDIPDGRQAQRIINAASHEARLQLQRTQNTRLYQTSGPLPGTPIGAAAGDHQMAASAPDPIEQLRKLAELRDAGILTEEEFSAKKADILSRM